MRSDLVRWTAAARAVVWPRIGRLLPEALVLIVLAGYALQRGQDLNYDQLNYHFLYAHLLLSGQLDSVHPSLIGQRYYNPLVNVPWALGVQVLPPRLLTLAVVAVQAVNFALVRRIAEVVLAQRGWLPICAALVGLSGSAFLSVVGTSFTDASTSVLVLGAVLLLLRQRSRGSMVGLGVLAGAAMGLKATNGVYVIGLMSGVTWLHYRSRGRSAHRPSLLWVIAGAAAGIALTGLGWAVHLWQRTGSPLFPFYNSVFRSDLLPTTDLHDSQFLPRGIGPLIAFPLQLARGQAHVLEQPVRDARWLVVLILALGVGAVALSGRLRRRGSSAEGNAAAATLLVVCVVSFVVWAVVFRYLRYLIPLELLSGVLIALAVRRAVQRDALAGAVVLALGATLLWWGRVPDWGHAQGFPSSWYGIRTEVLQALPRGAVVITDQDSGPVSYAAAWLPQGTRIVGISQGIAMARLGAGSVRPGEDLMLGTGLDRAVRQVLLDAHRNGAPLYVLRGRADPALNLRPFGVVLDRPCQDIGGPGEEDLTICSSHLEPQRAAEGTGQ